MITCNSFIDWNVRWLEDLVLSLCFALWKRELSPVGKGCSFFGFQESLANRFYLHLCFWGLRLTSKGLVQDNRRMHHLFRSWN